MVSVEKGERKRDRSAGGFRKRCTTRGLAASARLSAVLRETAERERARRSTMGSCSTKSDNVSSNPPPSPRGDLRPLSFLPGEEETLRSNARFSLPGSRSGAGIGGRTPDHRPGQARGRDSALRSLTVYPAPHNGLGSCLGFRFKDPFKGPRLPLSSLVLYGMGSSCTETRPVSEDTSGLESKQVLRGWKT